ncbi:MAG: bifunctional (p)ppGpp synthetase/guanosine-3',5'-bis(diphosphate) 3'-pyrophosphohydrolase [Burkholderiales bacterium]
MSIPRTKAAESALEPERWLDALTVRLPEAERDLVARAHAYASRAYGEGGRMMAHARGVAGVLGALRMDGESLAAALLLGVDLEKRQQREALEKAVGSDVLPLLDGVARMAPIQALRECAQTAARSSDKAAQLEALRKMLLAMVQDVRVVLVRLADQVQLLRELAAGGSEQERQDAAGDALELLAPLANRLGVWQLKWELEDLAFRCLEPDTYKSIARKLDEKRIDREAYIGEVTEVLREALAQAGIRADVMGRPKHIYSIFRKMQRKNVGFEDLSDVRAVRVLVEDTRDCYAVLGLAHQLWTPIPGEFDDYIAKPKANDYRSLHTAVVGPESRVLEVQIRTREMHRHAELGVAAHWRYKESARPDPRYDRKLSWLRSILDWREDLADAADLAESFRGELLEDSVYLLTPQGRVIDLPQGATPVDFAYRVHTDLGHRCRGARVNGQMVPLNFTLSNGQVVEIVAAKEGGPSRDWLNPALGFLRGNRARTKVRQWFNSQALDDVVAQGRAALEKELHRLGASGLGFEELASRLGHARPEDLFAAYLRGDISSRQMQIAVRGEEQPAPPAPSPPATSSESRSAGAPGVLIVGVDKLLTALGRCCKPAPPDPIVGFVTRGKGVTVHRRSCSNLKRLPGERLIAAGWSEDTREARFPVDVEIEAGGQQEVMQAVLDMLSREKVKVLGSRWQLHDLNLRIGYTLEVTGLDQLTRLLAQIRGVPGVLGARRR